MRKFFLFFLIFIIWGEGHAQFNHNSLQECIDEHSGAYVTLKLSSQEEVQKLLYTYSIERGDIKRVGDQYQVKVWLTQRDLPQFISENLPYEIDEESYSSVTMAPSLSMATTMGQMSYWNRYPTYDLYLEMMQYYQSQYPNLCVLDTILLQTQLNHTILAAKIGRLDDGVENKPAFFYSAAMHGDELCGYVILLRMIDYMLTNQSNPVVSQILDQVDLYICPLENPDGTFPSNNNSVAGSVRYNAQGYDLNRNYPVIGYAQQPQTSFIEIAAMLDFIDRNQIMMAANLHGGAELYNYAWDSYTTYQNPHPDRLWWLEIGNRFLDTVRAHSTYYYFTDEGGITNGGDWYVIYGSRLDCFNYYHQCRDATIEISSSKQTPSSYLPTYWNYLYRSLLNYVLEASYGIVGTVTDSLTHEPLEATVLIVAHDIQQTKVNSMLPSGKYHRPVAAGTYSVNFSAPGYHSKTFTVTVNSQTQQVLNVELAPINDAVDHWTLDRSIQIYPNPVKDLLFVTDNSEIVQKKQISIFNNLGVQVYQSDFDSESIEIEVSQHPAGVYYCVIQAETETVVRKFVKFR